MGFFRRIEENLTDVFAIGPSFLRRHLPKLTGATITRLTIPDIGPVFVRTSEGDAVTFRQVFVSRDYDLGEGSPANQRISKTYDSILQAGKVPVVIDAGANVGSASLWFAKLYPNAKVLAIEPEPGNVEILRRNVAGRGNIQVLDSAIGSRTGFVEVAGQSWGARTSRSAQGVEVITVEDAVSSVPGGKVFIVKVDIEGFEEDLFAQNTDWLDEAQMVIIEPHDWMLPGQRTSGNFQQAMGSREFEIFLSGENLIYVRG